MRQYKYLFLISFLFFSIFANAQRINPSSRIQKATDSTYILLSDIDGKYQHTKLVAESGISFNISNDTIYISATGGGTSGVSSITGGLGIDPDGSNTGALTLSFDPTEFRTLSTLDGNEDMWGYSSVVGEPVKYDIQGVFSNVLNDQANGIDFTESGTNQINVDLDLGELPLGTTFDGAFLLLGNYGTSTERTTYFQYLLKNTLTSTDGSVTFTDNSFTLDLSASGGGGMTSFNIQEDGGALEAIGDGETVEFISGSNMNITRSINDLTFNVTGLDNYSSWTARADDANTDLITSGETVDFAGGTGVITTNDLTNININLQPTQFTIDNSPPSSDYVWTFDNFGNMARTQISSLPISGSGMTSWTARTEDLVTTTVSDGTILDFEAGNGLKTQTSLGDVKVLLDGPSLINLGSITGAYEMWVHSGVITGARSVQNILTDVLTSSDGSVTIGTSGNSVNLTTSGGGTDGDANWDDTSVYLSASGGADISSTTISSTHSDKRNFNVSLNATSASTSNTQLLMPSASSTYQYHIFTVSCADNSATYNCQISNTVSGTYNMTDGELVVLRASQYEGSWTWFVN